MASEEFGHTHTHTHTLTDKERKADRQIDRQADRQTERQTDKKINDAHSTTDGRTQLTACAKCFDFLHIITRNILQDGSVR